MSASLYVYYTLAPSEAAALASVVKHFFAEVRRQGLCAAPRLMLRDGAQQTWMEVYEDLADAQHLQAVLEALWRNAETPAALQRHYECFVARPL